MNLTLSIPKFLVKFVLWLSRFFSDNNFVLVCKGYDGDWKNYTGLYWDDDSDNDFGDYEDFQIWLNWLSCKKHKS